MRCERLPGGVDGSGGVAVVFFFSRAGACFAFGGGAGAVYSGEMNRHIGPALERRTAQTNMVDVLAED